MPLLNAGKSKDRTLGFGPLTISVYLQKYPKIKM